MFPECEAPTAKPKRRAPSTFGDERKHEPRRQKASSTRATDHKRRKKHDGDSVGLEDSEQVEPLKETEEEYDARLEREEAQRLETQRRIELERIRRDEDISKPMNGVRYKGIATLLQRFSIWRQNKFDTGRGRMQFKDPELQERR
jgi:peptidyl-prolyl isomerase G (cyclophilin G)